MHLNVDVYVNVCNSLSKLTIHTYAKNATNIRKSCFIGARAQKIGLKRTYLNI